MDVHGHTLNTHTHAKGASVIRCPVPCLHFEPADETCCVGGYSQDHRICHWLFSLHHLLIHRNYCVLLQLLLYSLVHPFRLPLVSVFIYSYCSYVFVNLSVSDSHDLHSMPTFSSNARSSVSVALIVCLFIYSNYCVTLTLIKCFNSLTLCQYLYVDIYNV